MSEDAKTVLNHIKSILENEQMNEELASTIMKKVQKETGVKGKNLFMPVRAAISGQSHGPEMSHLFMVLGNKELIERLDYALNNF